MDVPNSFVDDLFRKAMDSLGASIPISEEREKREELSKLVEDWNSEVSSYLEKLVPSGGNWFKAKKPRLIQVGTRQDLIRFGLSTYIDWVKFLKFLNDLAESELNLLQKYDYINYCLFADQSFDHGNHQFTQSKVKKNGTEEIGQISSALNELRGEIDSYQDRFIKLGKSKAVGIATLHYFSELTGTIEAVRGLVENGRVVSAYRELRSVIEALSRLALDDLLFFRALQRGMKRAELDPRPYANLTREWFKTSTINNEEKLKHLSSIQKPLRLLVDVIGTENADQITKELLRDIDYPTLLTLGSLDKTSLTKIKEEPHYSYGEVLTKHASSYLEEKLRQLGQSEDGIRLVREEIKRKFERRIVPKYPHFDFILQLLDATMSTNAGKLYDDYCNFVHSDFVTWTPFPFFSVLEIKNLFK